MCKQYSGMDIFLLCAGGPNHGTLATNYDEMGVYYSLKLLYFLSIFHPILQRFPPEVKVGNGIGEGA